MTTASSTPARPGPPEPASPRPGPPLSGPPAPAPRAPAPRAPAPRGLPSLARTSLSRGRLEITSFFRDRESVIFTFSLPVILLVVFGEVFHGTIGSTGVAFRQYFAAGIIASGIMSATFVNVGASVAADRADGTLTRLAGTPMPPAAYFAGKALGALAVAAAEAALLLAVGAAAFGLRLPGTAGRWLTLGWVFVLGTATCAVLGLALSSLPRSTRGSSAVFSLPYLVLSFISGVYFVFRDLPPVLQQVAALFPLKWLCQGLRSVFLPAAAAVAEPARSWETGKVALVLGAWFVAGLVLCLTTFRWLDRE
jgi:ABC-2 type transport system permease protein